jgi:hypothetical protein
MELNPLVSILKLSFRVEPAFSRSMVEIQRVEWKFLKEA